MLRVLIFADILFLHFRLKKDCSALTNAVLPSSIKYIAEIELPNDTVQSTSNIEEGKTFSGGRNLRLILPVSVITVKSESFDSIFQKYIDGVKTYLDRIDFESQFDKNNFLYRVPVSFLTDQRPTTCQTPEDTETPEEQPAVPASARSGISNLIMQLITFCRSVLVKNYSSDFITRLLSSLHTPGHIL